jgi:hypothetical protein
MQTIIILLVGALLVGAWLMQERIDNDTFGGGAL